MSINFDNIYEYSIVNNPSTNSISIFVHEFIDVPKRFLAKKNKLTQCTTAFTQTEYIYEKDKVLYDRITYYSLFPHFKLRYYEHSYHINLEKTLDFESAKVFAKEYMKLAIKFHISPNRIGQNTKEFSETRVPVGYNEAEQAKVNAIARFQNIIN